MLIELQATHSLCPLCPLWLILLNSGSIKLPLTKLNAKCHSGRQMLTQKRCSVGRDAETRTGAQSKTRRVMVKKRRVPTRRMFVQPYLTA